MYLSMELEADGWLDKAEEINILNEIKSAYFEKGEDIIAPCEQLNKVDQK
jgi:hypothetical protein